MVSQDQANKLQRVVTIWEPFVIQKGVLIKVASALLSKRNGLYWVEFLDNSYEYVHESQVVWQQVLYWPEF